MTKFPGRFREYVTAGTWCVDNNKLLVAWPEENTSNEIIEQVRTGGGSACNFAIDLKTLEPGLNVSTIGLVGDDQDGRFLLDLASNTGVDPSGLRCVSGETTHFTDAFVDQRTGYRTHMYLTGVNARMTPEDFDFSDKHGCFLHLGLAGAHKALDLPYGGDATGWVTILKKAKDAGMTTNIEMMTIDPQILARLNRPSLPYLDLLIVNDSEIGALAGIQTIQESGTDLEACKRAASAVIQMGSMEILVVHFPDGAFCLTRDGDIFAQGSIAIPDQEVAGANGAGDAFAAGFICGLSDDQPLDSCLKYAHAAAAASLRHISTTGSIKSIATCLQLAQRWGWKT